MRFIKCYGKIKRKAFTAGEKEESRCADKPDGAADPKKKEEGNCEGNSQ